MWGKLLGWGGAAIKRNVPWAKRQLFGSGGRAVAGGTATAVATGVVATQAGRRAARREMQTQTFDVEATVEQFPVGPTDKRWWIDYIGSDLAKLEKAAKDFGVPVVYGRGGGGGGFGGALNLVMDPEVVPTASWDPRGERYVCPPGWVLVEAGDGPVCMMREVAYALGFRRRPRRGGISAREVAAARKVQRFGLGLFVNKQPKVRLKKGGRR